MATGHAADNVRAGRPAHVCDCVPVSYELCTAGGLMFIRRTDRTRGAKPEVRETERLITSRAQVMWRDLLLGIAR